VSGAFNAILVSGDAAGDQMFYGRGAGQMPTASAVWSDAIEIARRIAHQHATLAEDFPLGGERRLRMRPMSEVRSAYYLRAMVQDRPRCSRESSAATTSRSPRSSRGRAGAMPADTTHEARNMAAALGRSTGWGGGGPDRAARGGLTRRLARLARSRRRGRSASRAAGAPPLP
jgi:hypothetical protein